MDKKDILKKAQKEGNDERTERNQLAFSTMTLVFLYIVTAILVAIQSVPQVLSFSPQSQEYPGRPRTAPIAHPERNAPQP